MNGRPSGFAPGQGLAYSLAALLAALSLTPSQAHGQHTLPAAQHRRALSISLEAGGIVGTPFVEDGNGVTVRARPGPFVGGTVSVPVSPRIAVGGGLRASMSALQLESPAGEWRGGTTSQTDLRLGVETSIARGMRIACAASVARVAGPRHVVPFRAGGGTVWMWGPELAGTIAVPGQPRFALIAALSAARVASRPAAEPPVDAGWVGQLRLGVRGTIR